MHAAFVALNKIYPQRGSIMTAKTKRIIYKCSHVKKKVKLDVENELEKSLFGSKVTAQTLVKCDLQAMGGCSMRIERFDTKCPAVAQASKCALK